jgi:hypothetical protein
VVAEEAGSGVLVNAAESEVLIALEKFLNATDAQDPVSVRTSYDYDDLRRVG